MKLVKHSDNSHELIVNGGSILFSYETPVAVSVHCNLEDMVGVYKTEQKFSKTTSKHINQWTDTQKTLPQEEIVRIACKLIKVA